MPISIPRMRSAGFGFPDSLIVCQALPHDQTYSVVGVSSAISLLFVTNCTNTGPLPSSF